MWLKYKRRIRWYKVFYKDGSTHECRWGWYYFRRYEDQISRVEEFYKWEEYERWVGKKKFQKKPHHKKKVKSEAELNKEAWRKHKGHRKDKAKRLGVVNHCFGDGPPPWLKRQCNKKHRQWERRCIHREEYAKMNKRDVKRYLNPWDWY